MKNAIAAVALLAGAKLVSVGDAPPDGTWNVSTAKITRFGDAYATTYREVAFMPDSEPGALWIVEQSTGHHIRVGHFDSAGTWHFAPCK